jgi:hypothetical protein
MTTNKNAEVYKVRVDIHRHNPKLYLTRADAWLWRCYSKVFKVKERRVAQKPFILHKPVDTGYAGAYENN